MKRKSLLVNFPIFIIFSFLIIGCPNPTGGFDPGTFVPGTNLAGKLQWLAENAESGNTYTVEVDADETIARQNLLYAGKDNITLIDKKREIIIFSDNVNNWFENAKV